MYTKYICWRLGSPNGFTGSYVSVGTKKKAAFDSLRPFFHQSFLNPARKLQSKAFFFLADLSIK